MLMRRQGAGLCRCLWQRENEIGYHICHSLTVNRKDLAVFADYNGFKVGMQSPVGGGIFVASVRHRSYQSPVGGGIFTAATNMPPLPCGA